MSFLKKIIFLLYLSIFSNACIKENPGSPVPKTGLAGSHYEIESTLGHTNNNDNSIYRVENKISGLVTKSIKKESYNYIKIKTANKEEKWCALVNEKAKENEYININVEIELINFFSKTLNKTFPSISFGRLIDNADAKSN